MQKLWIWCVFMALSAVTSAQNPVDTTSVQILDEVVVSDSRFPLKREQSGKTVIRLGPEILKSYQGASVAQVLNQQTGIEISGSRGRPGEVLGVFIRGGRGRQVVVRIDGLRVSDPSSAAREYDLRLLPVAGIESIEIIKGATSVLYGANAATAVIDIRTKSPEKKPFYVNAQGSFGTQNTPEESDADLGVFNHSAQLGGSQGKWDYQAAISQDYANGLSSLEVGTEPDPYSNWSADMRVGNQLSEKSRLGVFANLTNMKADYDDSFNGTDAPFQYRTSQKRAGLQWQWKDTIQEFQLLGAFTDFESENRSDFPGSFDGSNWTADLTYKRKFGEYLNALVGLNMINDKATLENDEEFTIVDPYLNLVWTGPHGLNLNGGLRVNIHSTYGTLGVYHLNPSYAYKFEKGYLKVMGSWATAYITPSLAQLYGAFGANPELEAEKNRTLEAGLELSLNTGVRISGLFFDRREENTILFDNADFIYFNAGEPVRVKGFEGELIWEWTAGGRVGLNYTFTEPEGANAIRIPKHKFNAVAQTPLGKRFSALVRYSYTGTRTDTDFTTFTQVELEPFSLVDLRLDYVVMPGKLDAFISASNLLNESFTEVLGFQTPGRNLMIGWSLKL
ncbi:TonB-dependent receptor plug domain-containing protein [Robiginitalea aurantiaca]|uniref:TonB-dependent receptor plug domain-containing protein n=1 Tax=Robiginitalea aurantiaca TaxID=3056915 RepID=A0ABT7WCB2_9FLAO|nr:TonB-dependent receptor plug domain-containing protein [Robiginitalea aurantiaca]MDM9630561.1 TonB-dependent receptor plug domain-containing protein [Robiginitalea aurantiaca]